VEVEVEDDIRHPAPYGKMVLDSTSLYYMGNRLHIFYRNINYVDSKLHICKLWISIGADNLHLRADGLFDVY
jgi:hypothetical protein